jgi:sirohydrochlorin ferrochelatase
MTSVLKEAVLLVSHGSRSPETKKEVSALVRRLRRRLPGKIIEFAFLEIASPDIPEGIDRCVSHGAGFVVLILNFLNSGRHVNDDIPDIIGTAKKKYPQIKFTISKPVGQHARIPELFIDLIHHAQKS